MDSAHGKGWLPRGLCVCTCLESHSSSNGFCHCLLYEAGNHFKALRLSEGVREPDTTVVTVHGDFKG